MSRFLIDTNVISQFVKPKPHPNVMSWIGRVDRNGIFVCAITATELIYGVECLRQKNPTSATKLAPQIRWLLRSYQDFFLPITVKEAELLGKMYATPALRRFITSGTTIKPTTGADLMVASCAIINDMILVSRNVSDFLDIHKHFALPGLFDPFADEWAVRPPPSMSYGTDTECKTT